MPAIPFLIPKIERMMPDIYNRIVGKDFAFQKSFLGNTNINQMA